MCLGLAVPAMAVTISGTPAADSETISSVVSQEEVYYCDTVTLESYDTMEWKRYPKTMYTVEPGTVVSSPGDSL